MYLLLGASGMLGSSFSEELSKYGSPRLLMPSHAELDLTKEGQVFAYLKKHRPQHVINCAAAKNVDWCEKNPQEAFIQNSTAVSNLARACRANGSRLYHISTDYVFDGNKTGPYLETDQTNPINVYGASKLFGETNALKYGGTVFRVQWLFGPTKTNFVSWIAAVIKNGDEAALSKLQMGSPSSTQWVSQVILLSIGKKLKPDLYHLSHDDWCTRFDVASVVCEYFKRDVNEVFEHLEDYSFGVAKRPLNSCLDNSKLRSALNLQSLGTWREDLLYFLGKNYLVT